MIKLNAYLPWDEESFSEPIDDLRTWQKRLGWETGYYSDDIRMNKSTLKMILRSHQFREYRNEINVDKAELMTQCDVDRLLWGGTPIHSDEKIELIKIDKKMKDKEVYLGLKKHRDYVPIVAHV